MYSKELTLAGQTDCIEYRDKLSVIDFKTANKEKIEDWVDNYFLQCTAMQKCMKKLIRKKDRTNCRTYWRRRRKYARMD